MPHPTPHPNHFPKTNASQRQTKQDHSKHAKITRGCLLKWQCSFSNHHKSLRLPRKMNMSSKENDKTAKKNTLVTHQKMRNSARLPAKMHMAFFSPSQNTASATQNGRAQSHSWPQVEMHIFQLKNWKNAFSLHKKQISKGTDDDVGDGETQGLRVYIYIYIYIINNTIHIYICIYVYIYI